MVQACLPSGLQLSPREHYVLCRIVRAEGDGDIAPSVRLSPGAVEAGLNALKAASTIVTDVRMVEMGISKALLRGAGVATTCAIDLPEVAERARRDGTTRSVAAIRELAPSISGSVCAIGNAPTALLALLDLIDAGEVNPALVIGMPGGICRLCGVQGRAGKAQHSIYHNSGTSRRQLCCCGNCKRPP
ncbi:Cobalt-precorrin-8 methylmutase [Geodia barretti]|uniref:Cobalt-precorrin-8 methylmutase n=1 Tax=Geodia barretti TaxID=519541 RepID=A0AA35SJ46_GEOBA|nr:Cobalt-precorrin-8 methylmutase [Geodia barretti]